MNKISDYLFALAIMICGILYGWAVHNDYREADVVIESTTGATNVGKVSSEVLTYRFKIVDAGDSVNQKSTGFMDLGVMTPSEFIVPFLEAALGANFSYDAVLVKSMVVVIETHVTYTGDKGSAQKLIDSRSLVFHTGTTMKEVIADTTLHSQNVIRLYKKEHSYVR